RVDSFDLRQPVRRLVGMSPPREKALDEGFWHRVATTVMKRPIPVATAVVAVLVLLGTPFLSAAFSLPDDRVLPKSAQAYQVGQVMRDEFPGNEFAALSVVAPSVGAAGAPELNHYALALSKVDGVGRVDAATGT